MTINRAEYIWEHFCRLISSGALTREREMTLEEETAHAAGIARLCQLLAHKRGVDPGLAYILGVLHDYGRLHTGTKKDHARIGSELVQKFLETTGLFSPSEIADLTQAIARHSSKAEVGGPLEELIKDCDVLDNFLAGEFPAKPEARARLQFLADELGIELGVPS